ncbi:hypothetical protein DVK44_06705 [Streptomyces paludis]|uniref:Large membrane protein n=1 Tax=Streptomyces paludis TaxID=2282738 RepID=A0A345I0D8_9ACTN|nr:hypothetical protein DVK44_06705 [Streptomyces paludis]
MSAAGRWRPRRPRVAVATVAAAVLLAGGGGAYFATNAFGGGSSTDGAKGSGPDSGTGTDTEAGRSGGSGKGGDGGPPLLTLDDTVAASKGAPGAPGAPASSAGSSDPSAPKGIAVGEPDPGGVTYRAKGKLPEGPDSARVYRTSGDITSAEVARLAKALGLTGTPKASGTVWKVGPDKDGSGPVLSVAKQAPGTWTYAQTARSGSDNCLKGKACPEGGAGDSSVSNGGGGGSAGSAVSEAAAKKAAAPVLKALGQADADLDARQLMGSTRVVNADPVIGGLPTYGWSTGLQVGTDGQVIGGSGQLAEPEQSDAYPVIGADAALKALNRAAEGAGSGGRTGGCATAVPLEGSESAPSTGRADAPAALCGPAKPRTARAVEIDKAVFGLAVRSVEGRGTLVPSWLFEVAPGGDAPSYTVTHPAVAPEFLAQPVPEPVTSSGAFRSYTVNSADGDGRKLTLHFMGGVCALYTPQADESGTAAVKVKLIVSHPDPDRVCIAIAKEQSVTVTLDKPLGKRLVVDAETGGTIARG